MLTDDDDELLPFGSPLQHGVLTPVLPSTGSNKRRPPDEQPLHDESVHDRIKRLRIASLHRRERGWIPAYVAYLASGGYELQVGPELIRRVKKPTLVVWGSDDPVLDPGDAKKFERDLPECVGVREVEGCGHSPHVEKPEVVAAHLASFLRPSTA